MSLYDIRRAEGNMEKDRMALAELIGLYKAFPNSAMGVSDNDSYRITYYRVVGIFAGAPIGIDVPAWMDLKLGDVPDDTVERLLIGCGSPFWIIPNRGMIFSLREPIHGELVFSDRFRQRFIEEYKRIRDGAYFSVWTCQDDRHETGRVGGLIRQVSD
jgi:hypothetical protein